MFSLYKTLVRPHVQYCIQAWRPHMVRDIEKNYKERATMDDIGLWW